MQNSMGFPQMYYSKFWQPQFPYKQACKLKMRNQLIGGTLDHILFVFTESVSVVFVYACLYYA